MHDYSEPGTYSAVVTVTDLAGNVSTYDLAVTVTVPAGGASAFPVLEGVTFGLVGIIVVLGVLVLIEVTRRRQSSGCTSESGRAEQRSPGRAASPRGQGVGRGSAGTPRRIAERFESVPHRRNRGTSKASRPGPSVGRPGPTRATGPPALCLAKAALYDAQNGLGFRLPSRGLHA